MVFVGVQFISGIMFGIEVVWDSNMVVFDLGIVRVIVQLESKE